MSTDVPPLRILAFEPFDGGSHRAVRASISRHSRHAWRWFTAPARSWKWRMRLGAMHLVDDARAAGALEDPIDAIFTTSLLSVPDLIASLPAGLRSVPVVLYMHENQAAYPVSNPSAPDERDVHFALTNLASVRCADLTIWNSAWNRDSFASGIAEVLRHAPAEGRTGFDPTGPRQVVIWPPVECPGPGEPDRVLHNPTRVVWPHRWEHDKGPDELLEIARRWTEPLDIRWTILGERFGKVPPALAEFERAFGDRLDAFGYEPDRDRYLEILGACDWVLSTARHEFFGIAVTEALTAGCLPWLPDRLSYPELLPASCRGLSPSNPPADAATARQAIRAHLTPARAAEAVARLDAAVGGLAKKRDGRE
jgi:glycosyltransferase involved in cell wall biosynthesis